MSRLNAALGMSGSLDAHMVRPSKPHRARSISLPGVGRIILTRDRGESTMFACEQFQTNLHALHRDGDGKVKDERDLGSGLVTNVGVLALANDFAWAAPSAAAINTFAIQKWVAVGKSATAAKATDLALNELAAPTTANAVEGTNSLVSEANKQILRNVATVNFTETEAITEWGIHSAKVLSATTGTPLTAKTAKTATVTGTPYTASSTTVQGQQQLIVQAATAEKVWGLITSNTTSVLTFPAWYKVSDGTAGAEPEATSAILIKPVMFDHRVFSVLNVENGDSIVFSWSLTVASGG